MASGRVWREQQKVQMGRPAEPPHKPIKDSTCLGDSGSQKAWGAAAHKECASSLSHKVKSTVSGEGRSVERECRRALQCDLRPPALQSCPLLTSLSWESRSDGGSGARLP